jgi:IclR family transcriptional regulator, acetate operon repressor
MLTSSAQKGEPVETKVSGVQSVERAFSILEEMARNGGEIGLTTLATKLGLAVPTVHRSMKTLVSLGYAKRNGSRKYTLGASLLLLGEAASRGIASWAKPTLLTLANECGETVNLATLEGDRVVYIGQSPSKHSMRMFTEAGRRVLPHACGVGKAILSTLEEEDAKEIISHTGMPKYTSNTRTTWKSLNNDLLGIRSTGFAIDEGEQEVGVRCIAAPLLGVSPPTAISISGPTSRVTDSFIKKFSPKLLETAADLANEFGYDE